MVVLLIVFSFIYFIGDVFESFRDVFFWGVYFCILGFSMVLVRGGGFLEVDGVYEGVRFWVGFRDRDRRAAVFVFVGFRVGVR